MNNMFSRQFLIVFFLLICTLAENVAFPVAQTELPGTSSVTAITVSIQEALPGGVSGVKRENEPVTLGLPLPELAGYKSANGFALQNGAPAQFRILARWPNGNIKWLLSDFQVSLAPGQSAQVLIANSSLGQVAAPLANEAATSIQIDTGKAQFVIRKANLNVFDSVTVQGIKLVKSGNVGRLVLRDGLGVEYSSANDAQSTAVIEENGPLRSVVKATGAFKNSAGQRLADYTLRLHFFKGKAYVKGFITLRNASKAAPAAVFFHSAEAIVPLALDRPTAVLSRNADALTYPLKPGEHAQLFQGYSLDKNLSVNKNCYTWDPPIPGTCSGSTYTFDAATSGLEITTGSQKPQAFGNNQTWTQGWAELRDDRGRGVTLGLRWMSAYWPAGFDLGSDGTASIELFSKKNPKTSLKLPFNRHEGRELIWDFNTQPTDNTKVLATLQYPLVARAPFSQYQQTGVLFGQKEFVSVAEQAAFFAALGKSTLFTGFKNPAMTGVYRQWPWAMGSGDNQTDFPLNDLQDYLRAGLPGYYLAGEQRTLFNALTAVNYADDFAQNSKTLPPVKDSNPKQPSLNGGTFDAEHAHMLSMPLYYFLSGNEEVKEAVLEYGEQLEGWQLRGYFPLPQTEYFRAWNRIYRNLALIYEFTCNLGPCNNAYRQIVEKATQALLDSRDDPGLGLKSPRGRNLERGYLFWDTSLIPTLNERVVHSFFHIQIHFEAMWQALRILNSYGTPYPRSEDTEDYLLGLAQFFLDEYYDEFGTGLTQAGFQYNYALDKPYTPQTSVIPYDVSRAALFAYAKTGNEAYLQKGYGMVWRTFKYATARTPSELQDQALMSAYFRKPSTWKYLAPKVSKTAEGYRMDWPLPVGAKKIQIKYADKPLVDSLGFNRAIRTYRYAPGSFATYFTAKNIANEPAPISGAGSQGIDLNNLSCGNSCYFAVKFLGQ